MKALSNLNIDDFNYDLPDSFIPHFPLENREDAKLLVYKQNKIESYFFKNITEKLPKNSVLIFNNTKVIQARLHFKTAANQTIELFCLEPHDCYSDVAIAMASTDSVKWKCLVGNLRKWKDEFLVLKFADIELKAKILEKTDTYVNIQFYWNKNEMSFAELLSRVGEVPIPPYLNRDTTETDAERYQTVYAQHKGSVAAPTAGLHFTESLLKELKEANIQQLFVTLHVGAGTFMPVKSNKIEEHVMHAEWIDVDLKTIQKLSSNLDKVYIAVGTTSLRTIETIYWMGLKAYLNPQSSIQQLEIQQWDAYQLVEKEISLDKSLQALINWMLHNNLEKLVCKTQILIAPPYKLKLTKGIITNFHQPKSTLLLLISAIVGDSWKTIYNYALKNNYRFLSYGDSSLLLPF
ncbi:MAG: S-adenosylmethionine:tRNA ribosyltransferase-isomerase [Bacteroidota bacterium]